MIESLINSKMNYKKEGLVMTTLKKVQSNEHISQFIYMVVGDFVYTLGFNLFIVPIALYSGGFMGISQLIQHFITAVMGINVPASLNLTGILYYLINIPIFMFGYKIMGKSFVIKSIVATTILTAFLMIVPIPSIPIVEDYLTACILGGIICGYGCGLLLRGRATGGGQDVIGVCLTKMNPKFSVGKVGIIINAAVYLVCFLLFDVEIVIYSLIFATVQALVADKAHTQNINMGVMIFTKKTGIAKAVMEEMGRGVTDWIGEGAYTEQQSYVLYVVISKYEVSQLKEIVHRVDSSAFMIFTEGCSVDGNFEKRL